MTSKNVKPNLNALNCVSLYQHETCTTQTTKYVTARRARMPKKRAGSGKPSGILGLREIKQAVTKVNRKDNQKPKRFAYKKEISLLDLAVASGFLLLFSAAAAFGMLLLL